MSVWYAIVVYGTWYDTPTFQYSHIRVSQTGWVSRIRHTNTLKFVYFVSNSLRVEATKMFHLPLLLLFTSYLLMEMYYINWERCFSATTRENEKNSTHFIYSMAEMALSGWDRLINVGWPHKWIACSGKSWRDSRMEFSSHIFEQNDFSEKKWIKWVHFYWVILLRLIRAWFKFQVDLSHPWL